MSDNPILTPQQLYDEFCEFQIKLKNNRSLFEVLTRGGNNEALFQAAMVTTQFVIANELHRIANALERLTPKGND